MADSFASNEQLQVLGLVCRRLNEAGIPYMVTGSIAAGSYGIPRMTRDIDIVIDITAEDATRVHELFEREFYSDLEAIIEETRRSGMFSIIHNEYTMKVDFIVRKNTEYRQAEFARRRTIPVRDFQCSLVRIEDRILSKLEWARTSLSELQLGDVRNLLDSSNAIDRDYIESWVQQLDLADVYKRVAG